MTAARATLRAVPRRGKPPPATSAALRSRAIAIVAARAERHEPPITGAALAVELEVDPRTARAILDELRAAELAPPAVVAGASGRRMAAAARPGKVVRLRQATIERLAEVTGRPVGEDVDAQVGAVLDRAITLRLSAAEDRALTAAAGSRTAVGSYLRGAGLALPLIVDALDSAGDTLTGEEACGLALGVLRRVVPRR